MARARAVKRRAARREPSARIIIVMEGSATEPNYIRRFKRTYRTPAVEVEEVPGAGTPLKIVNRAIDIKSELTRETRRRGSLARRDTVWVMFDRDDHPHFDRAVQQARDRGLFLAITNPCFELWGIFHYRDHDAPIDRHMCQRELRKLSPGYDHDRGASFDEAVIEVGYHDAVRRAQRGIERREAEGEPLGNPSTTVHLLTEHIIEMVKKFRDEG